MENQVSGEAMTKQPKVKTMSQPNLKIQDIIKDAPNKQSNPDPQVFYLAQNGSLKDQELTGNFDDAKTKSAAEASGKLASSSNQVNSQPLDNSIIAKSFGATEIANQKSDPNAVVTETNLERSSPDDDGQDRLLGEI